MIDLLQLELAAALADTPNFTRVAAERSMAAGAVAGHVRRLECELEHPLFRRARGGLMLTEAASLLVPKLQRLLDEVATARQLAEQLREGSLGRLQVGHVGPGFGPLTATLREAVALGLPDVELSMVRVPLAVGLGALQDQRIDVIVTFETRVRAPSGVIIDAPFLTEPRVLVLAAGDPLADESEILLEHLIPAPGADAERRLLAIGWSREPGGQLSDYFGPLPRELMLDAASARLRRVEDALDDLVPGAALLVPAAVARFYNRTGLVMRPFLDAPACLAALAWKTSAIPTVTAFRRVLADVASRSRAIGGLPMPPALRLSSTSQTPVTRPARRRAAAEVPGVNRHPAANSGPARPSRGEPGAF